MSEYVTEFFGSSSGGSYTERREPIVRCRDCEHMEEDDLDCSRRAFYCDRCGYVKPDGFCAWGVRRSE